MNKVKYKVLRNNKQCNHWPTDIDCCCTTQQHFTVPAGTTCQDYIRSRYRTLLIANIHKATVTHSLSLVYNYMIFYISVKEKCSLILSLYYYPLFHPAQSCIICSHHLCIFLPCLSVFICLTGISFIMHVWLNVGNRVRATISSINPSAPEPTFVPVSSSLSLFTPALCFSRFPFPSKSRSGHGEEKRAVISATTTVKIKWAQHASLEINLEWVSVI